MQTQDGELWTVETAVIESRQQAITAFSYYYEVRNTEDELLRREWNKVERWYPFDATKDYIFPDEWRDYPLPEHLYAAPLHLPQEAPLHLPPTGGSAQSSEQAGMKASPSSGQAGMKASPSWGRMEGAFFRKTVLFRVSAPQLRKGETLGLCGNHPSLGDWSPSRFLPMTYLGDSEWMLSVNVEHVNFPIEYKYVTVDEHRQVSRWEEGENRVVGNPSPALPEGEGAREGWGGNTPPPVGGGREGALRDGEVLVLHGGMLRLCEDVWKAAGVVVPVFSLRSESSYGVGDFGDLCKLIDWASAVGMKMIQLLPVNDTTTVHGWTDSHPYNCISVFALHPHYIDLEQLPPLKNKQDRMAFNRQRRELNALKESDYMAVDRIKNDYIAKSFAEVGQETLASDDFKAFFEEQKEWLVPYAAFCVLRDKFGTSRFMDWKQYADYRGVWSVKCGVREDFRGVRSEERGVRIVSPLENSVENLQQVSLFSLHTPHSTLHEIYYTQYHLHRQLRRASDYAHSKGVALKGDMPVGVYRDSVETWTHPELFDMEQQMGTMPSASDPVGQNWGFPTYRWGAAVEEWMRKRLRYMEQFFDAVRIDHILSFFRTWEIPLGAVTADLGHFAPSLSLSAEEIERYGLTFRHEFLTQPFINDRMIDRIFGIHAAYVRETFLEGRAYHLYALKKDVSTQERVQQFFAGKNDENSQWIRGGLMRLCANVLFVETGEGLYAPRYGAWQAPVFEALGGEERDAYMRIYNNYFYERHNDYWRHVAAKRLEAVLRDTRMLVCADDIGADANLVQGVLDSHRILSLEVQALPKHDHGEFGHLEANAYRSVATISTHDMPSMRLWWEEDPGRVQRYYATMLQKEGRAPRHLTPILAEEIIARHLYCPSMLCLLSIQDWLAMSSLKLGDAYQERINAPFDSYNRWKYRMPVTIEQLMGEEQYNRKLRTMIQRSKRV
jgi:4-alpha-glucanotransferase